MKLIIYKIENFQSYKMDFDSEVHPASNISAPCGTCSLSSDQQCGKRIPFSLFLNEKFYECNALKTNKYVSYC
jgi:hypothetical protein